MKMAEVVAEPVGISTHDVKDVGIAFVREYYTTAVTNVNGVFNMFGDDSVYIGDSGDEHIGQHDIRAAIASLNLHGGKVRIFSVGTAPVGSGGIIIQVFAAYVGDSCESRFTETFFLSQQKLAKYYVRSTIFKWIDQPPPVMVATPLDYGVNGHSRVTLENNTDNHNDSLPVPENQEEPQQETLIYQQQQQTGAVNQTQAEPQVQQVEPPSPTEEQPRIDTNGTSAAPVVNGTTNGTNARRNSRGRRHRGTPSPKDKDARNGRKNQQKVDENTAPRIDEAVARENGVANVNGNLPNNFTGVVYTNGNVTEHHDTQAPNGINKKPLGNRIDNRAGPRPVKPNTTVHVAGIEKHRQAEHDDVAADLRNIFSAYGEVIRVNVPLRCFSDDQHHAFAFVEFAARDGLEAIFANRQVDNRGRVVLPVNIPSLGHAGDISVAENRERPARYNGPPNSAQVRNARHIPDHRNGKGINNGVPQKPWKAAY